MRDLLSRAEHYRKKAEKYHELARFARPAYLGDFYRGVAVRYIFMAQEAAKRGEKRTRFTAEPSRPPDVECGGGQARHDVQDFELLARWTGDGRS
jgi:hypothetical protein